MQFSRYGSWGLQEERTTMARLNISITHHISYTHLYFTIIISYNYAIGYQYATQTHREKMESG